MEVLTPAIRKTSTCPTVTVGDRSRAAAHPDLTTFCRLNELGLVEASTRTCRSRRPGVYQAMIAAYREPDQARNRVLMAALIESVNSGVPTALTDIITLGRTLRSEPPTSWSTSTTLATPTDLPRPSMAASSTYAAPTSASSTSPTTSPDPCSRPADSDRSYTLDCDEPVFDISQVGG